jgi:hypothetical protein
VPWAVWRWILSATASVNAAWQFAQVVAGVAAGGGSGISVKRRPYIGCAWIAAAPASSVVRTPPVNWRRRDPEKRV